MASFFCHVVAGTKQFRLERIVSAESSQKNAPALFMRLQPESSQPASYPGQRPLLRGSKAWQNNVDWNGNILA